MKNEIMDALNNIQPKDQIILIWIVAIFAVILLLWYSMAKRDSKVRDKEIAPIDPLTDVDEESEDMAKLKNEYLELENKYKDLVSEFNEYIDLNKKVEPTPIPTSIGVICSDCGWKGKSSEVLTSYGHSLCPYCRKEFKELMI